MSPVQKTFTHAIHSLTAAESEIEGCARWKREDKAVGTNRLLITAIHLTIITRPHPPGPSSRLDALSSSFSKMHTTEETLTSTRMILRFEQATATEAHDQIGILLSRSTSENRMFSIIAHKRSTWKAMFVCVLFFVSLSLLTVFSFGDRLGQNVRARPL
jgi:hypothetical protein